MGHCDLPFISGTTRDVYFRFYHISQARQARHAGEPWAGFSQLRNCLAEHYFPWVYKRAASLARRMELRDRPNAVGEVLLAMVESIVPGYDGTSDF
jgi:hypothetical protein